MHVPRFVKLIVAVGVCEAAGAAGSLFTAPAIASGWYATLAKPQLAPPNWVFAPVWTVLYLLMGVALYLAWAHEWKAVRGIPAQGAKPWNRYSERLWCGSWQRANVIGIFAVQLALNALWSALFFGLRSPVLGFFCLAALWAAIVFTLINFHRISRPASWLLVPYLLWVTFAGYLNFAIWMLNVPL